MSSVNGELPQDQQIALLRGKFFCTTEDVWEVGTKRSSPEHWDAFWRNEGVNKNEGVNVEVRGADEGPLNPYKVTFDALLEDGRRPAPKKSARSGSSGSIIGIGGKSKKDLIWPVDIAGNVATSTHEIAHLIPAGPQIHEEWFGVAAAVLGLSKDASVEQQLMAARGVWKDQQAHDSAPIPSNGKRSRTGTARGTGADSAPPTRKKKAVSFDGSIHSGVSQDTDSTNSSIARAQCMNNTGVIHFVSNKIRMQLQGKMIDGQAPTILIVPCMTLKNAKEWRGESYKVMVSTGFPHGITNTPRAYVQQHGDSDIASDAFRKADLNSSKVLENYEKSPIIDQEEKGKLLEKARQGLEEAVLGLVEYVKEMKKKNLEPLLAKNKELLSQRCESFHSKNGKVVIPKGRPVPTKPVLFLDFGAVDEQGSTHPAPDPELLLAKAATIWGKMNDVEILANGGEPTDDGDSLDEVAEETFYENFRSSKTQVPNEISVVTPGFADKFGFDQRPGRSWECSSQKKEPEGNRDI